MQSASLTSEERITENGIIILGEINYTRQRNLHSDQEPEHGTFYLDLEPDGGITTLIKDIEIDQIIFEETPRRYTKVRESRKEDVEKSIDKLVGLLRKDLSDYIGYLENSRIKKISNNEFEYYRNIDDFLFRTVLKIDTKKKKIEMINYVYYGKFDFNTEKVYMRVFNPFSAEVNTSNLNKIIYSMLTGENVDKIEETPFDIEGVTLHFDLEDKSGTDYFVCNTKLLNRYEKELVAHSLKCLYNDLHEKKNKEKLGGICNLFNALGPATINNMIKGMSINHDSRLFLRYVVPLKDSNS